MTTIYSGQTCFGCLIINSLLLRHKKNEELDRLTATVAPAGAMKKTPSVEQLAAAQIQEKHGLESIEWQRICRCFDLRSSER